MSADTGRLHAGDARDVEIPAGSVTLAGELLVPSDPQGLVIFAHGGGPGRHSPRNRQLAASFRRAGLGTLLFDPFTSEEEETDRASGHLPFNMGLLTQRLVCAAHWVAGEDEARQVRLGFFGSSTGAGAALVAAADLGRIIGAAVSWGGRPDLAGNALRRVRTPTLLIAGELDDTVRELNAEALEMLDCPKCLALVPGAGPLYEEPGALEGVGRLASRWFLQHLHSFSGSRFTR